MFYRLGRFALAVVALGTVVGCVSVAPGTSVPPASLSVSSPPSVSAPSSASAPSSVSVLATPPPPAAASGAGSIAYIKDGDVWLAAPDGSGAHQLTTDGAQLGYHDPSQAPDGTILALHGPSTVVFLDRHSGAQVRTPATLTTLENGAETLAASPDGAHIVYTTTGFGQLVDPRFGTPNGAFIYGGTDVATLDGKSVSNAALPEMIFPAWLDASTLIVSDGTKLYLDAVTSAPQTWLDKSNGCLTDMDCPSAVGPAANATEPAVSSDGSMLAYSYRPYYGDGGRVMATISAPSQPPADVCMLPGQQNYSDPGAFAPDGTAFAFDDTTFDPNTLESTVGQGIYVVQLRLSSGDCGASAAVLAIPGGAQPSWGPLAP